MAECCGLPRCLCGWAKATRGVWWCGFGQPAGSAADRAGGTGGKMDAGSRRRLYRLLLCARPLSLSKIYPSAPFLLLSLSYFCFQVAFPGSLMWAEPSSGWTNTESATSSPARGELVFRPNRPLFFFNEKNKK